MKIKRYSLNIGKKRVLENKMIAIAIVIGIVLIPIMFCVSTSITKNNMLESSKDTIAYVHSLILQSDKVNIGKDTERLIFIKNGANAIGEYFSDEQAMNRSLLAEYAEKQRLSGVVVTDESLNPISYSNEAACSVWRMVRESNSGFNLNGYKNKSYMDHVVMIGGYYDCAVTARKNAPGYVFCYNDITAKKKMQSNEMLSSVLSRYRFSMNESVLYANGNNIIYSNNPNINSFNFEEILKENGLRDIPENKVVRIRYKNDTWYGVKEGYKNDAVYVFAPKADVFKIRNINMTICIGIIAVFIMLMYVIQQKFMQAGVQKTEKSIRIIKSISSMFEGVSLYFLDTGIWENIDVKNLGGEAKDDDYDDAVLYPGTKKFFEEIRPEYKEVYLKFISPENLRKRLEKSTHTSMAFQRTDGTWYHLIAVPQKRNDDGSLATAAIAVRNIDEYKKNEEKFIEELQKSAERERRANHVKADFLRRMSHDLHTPINGIRGMVAISNYNLGDAKKQKECNDKILSASASLLSLVNDVLNMSKLESGKVIMDEKSFEVYDFCYELADITRTQAVESGVKVVLNPLNTNVNVIVGSRIHLRQALLNIINNAIKYNHENGTVTLSCNEVSNDGETVVLEFKCEDTGRGISKEFYPHLFEPFAQEKSEARTIYEGSGLGLTISKELVEQMHGTIGFKSEVGKGTVFTVTLPFRIGNQSDVIEGEDDSYIKINKKPNILLAEDNELNMEIVEFLLENSGMEVTKAWNGQEAVNAFKNSEQGYYDVVLMDIMMPVMNGLEAARTIRSMDREDAVDVPIIAMSANSFKDDVERSMRAGMDEHLAKPVNEEILISSIKKYMALRERKKRWSL